MKQHDIININQHYKFLVVEDDSHYQEFIRMILVKRNYVVDLAADGKTAFELIKVNQYNIIFMDINLPDMQGTEITKILRAPPYSIKTPIIAVTGYGIDFKEEAIQAGMNDLLSKPFKIEEMLKIISLYTH